MSQNRVSKFFKYLLKGWNILGRIIICFLLIEFLSHLILLALPKEGFDTEKVSLDAYDEATWVREYYQEYNHIKTEWEPYVYHKHSVASGDHINVDEDGIRASVLKQKLPPQGRPVKVLFLGGSVMWGNGVPDEFTIPSVVGQKLAELGWVVETINFANKGWTSTQEVIQLIKELEKGDIPDYVIFLDGINDIMSAIHNGKEGVPLIENRLAENYEMIRSSDAISAGNFLRKRLESAASITLFNKLMKKIGSNFQIFDRTSPKTHDVSPEKITRIYRENVRMIQALGLAYDFQPLFLWQPSLLHRKELRGDEELVLNQQIGRMSDLPVNLINQVYSKIESKDFRGANFHNLSEVFDDFDRPVFLDLVHLSHLGNEVIASKIVLWLEDLKSSVSDKNTSQ